MEETLRLYRRLLELYGDNRYFEAIPLAEQLLVAGEKLLGAGPSAICAHAQHYRAAVPRRG